MPPNMQPILIGIGAGLAAALFTIVPAMRGSMGSMLIALAGFLPIMLAGLAFSPTTALIATAAGAAVIFIFSPYAAILFAIAIGLPCWQLARLAWLARPAEAGEAASDDGLVWYPLERLFMWTVALGAALACANLLMQVFMAGGFEAFVARLTKAFRAFIEISMKSGQSLPQGLSPEDFAHFAISAALPQAGGLLTAVLAINFWIAGRVAKSSNHLRRPWADLPENLRLPPQMAWLFALALFSTILTGLPRMLGMTIATAIGMGFAIQGFATLHAFTRGQKARPLLLSLAYSLTIMLQGMPLMLMALIGVADTYWNLRAKAAQARQGQPPGAPPSSRPPDDPPSGTPPGPWGRKQ